uniref:Serine/arginine repetitive matrix protein C-terminal domain-containing protein n=1 Tax=Mola mola TaxID=94237 RepID=A0A3Q3VJT1_MOLML
MATPASEKQLFEKFWKGTFKAVATPRPESVIMASITARKRVTKSKYPFCSVSACSPSFDEELSPRPKEKKKKRKSERKRKRKSEMYFWAPFVMFPKRKKEEKKKTKKKKNGEENRSLYYTSWVFSYSLFVCLQILSSQTGSKLLHRKGSQHLSSHTDRPHDYDSGNDTSSPPSSKTGVSQASVTDSKRNHCKHLASPEKLKFTDRDNVSDSGNSVTSYASCCKSYREECFSATLYKEITLGCQVEGRKTSSFSQRLSKSPRSRRSSSSRSRSSRSFKYSGRYSRSLSLSSRRLVKPLLCTMNKKGVKRAHKISGKRRRRKSYSPMKKRRRDSPSHLEARRITSARKRPIPYFRRSPSSSGRSTSVSSWSSIFTRSRSRSPIHSISRSRSRSRSHSYSSYRSYSRSSSWNSIFGTRSRSRSRGSWNRRGKARH